MGEGARCTYHVPGDTRGDPGRLYLGVEFEFWHNTYGISGLKGKVLLPLLVWTL